MKNLLLLTWKYPFGDGERSFIGSEIPLLTSQFHLTILAADVDTPLYQSMPSPCRVDRFHFTPLHTCRSFRAFLMLLAPEVLRDIWKCWRNRAAEYRSTSFLKELLSYHYHVWQSKQVIRKIIRRDHIDLVYSYWCAPFAVAALQLKTEFPNLKVITRFHGADLYIERTSIGWQSCRDMIAHSADLLVFACRAGRDYFLSHWGGNDPALSSKSIVSYLGSRQIKRPVENNTSVLHLLSCAMTVPLKRIPLIIEALQLLPEEIRVKWDHIGNGVDFESLRHQAEASLSHCPNIEWKFWGYILNCDLDEVYAKISPDLFITTTKTEGGVPVSIQEIFSIGIPAVGTAVGGIPEIVENGKTGILLCADPTAEEVAKAIQSYALQSREQRMTMSDNAYRKWRKQFSAEKNAESFITVLHTL